MGVSPAFQGGPASLSGALPAAFFFPGAAGNIPLTLTRTFSDGPSVYNLITPATGNGTVPCPDGSTGKWTASVFGVTAVVTGSSGNFLVPVSSTACGNNNFDIYSGLATFGPAANGAVSLVLHLTGFLVPGTARAIGSAASPNGSYGFQIIGSPFPSGVVGVMNFDGVGRLTASFTGVGGTTAFTGTYSPNPDGTGTITIMPTANPSAAATVFAYVATDDGSSILLLRTSGGASGGVISAGSARLQ